MIATLPMYELPGLEAVHDALWSAIARELGERNLLAPPRLERRLPDAEAWSHPGLVLSQTCGRALFSVARGLVPIAVGCYRAPGCEEGRYQSAIVVRRGDAGLSLDELAQGRGAVNDWESHSGWSALVATLPMAPAAVEITGSHRESLRALQTGRADVAAIDRNTWTLLERHHPSGCEGLAIVAESESVMGVPFVVPAARAPRERRLVYEALGAAVRSCEAAHEALGLFDVRPVSFDDYERVRQLAVRAPPRAW